MLKGSASVSEKVGIQPYVCLQAVFIRSLDICGSTNLVVHVAYVCGGWQGTLTEGEGSV